MVLPGVPQWRWQPQGGHCLLWHGTVPLQSLAWELSSFAGRVPGSSSARSWDGGQVKALGEEEEEVGGLCFPLPGCSPPLLSLRPHGSTNLPLSLHPKWYQALIAVGFCLNCTLELCLDYFIRENLGKKMVVSEANSSLLGTGRTKGERGLAVSSSLLPCGCGCATMAPSTPQPLQGHVRGQAATSTLRWHPPAAQASKAANGFQFPSPTEKKGFDLLSEGTGWLFGAKLVVLAVRVRWGCGAHRASPAAPQTGPMPRSPDMRHLKRCPLLHSLLPCI